MHQPAFHCPACGGPQKHGGPGRCDFCGSVRVPLGVPDPRTAQRCPACASLVDGHHSFCPRCGAAQGDSGPPIADSELPCPGCAATMAVWPLDPRLSGSGYRGIDPLIHGCQSCGGAWVDRKTLDAIIEAAEAQAPPLDSRSVPRKIMAMADVVVYRPCPRCHERMHRRNFGRFSGIVVDECSSCGTFFDAGELDGVVAFVRGGGLALARHRDADNARVELVHRQWMNTPDRSTQIGASSGAMFEAELELVIEFLRWLGRWIRRRINR